MLQVLVVALEIFDLHRSMQDLFSCGMQKHSLVAACKLSQVWHVRSGPLTKDGTWALCIENTDSKPLDHQGSGSTQVSNTVNLINKTQGGSLYRTHSWLIVLVLQISRDLQATITLTQRRVPFNITLEFLVLLDELFLLLSLLCSICMSVIVSVAFVASSLSFMELCDFELENVCGMIQSSADSADWQRLSQVSEGPESDHSNMGRCRGNRSEILLGFILSASSLFLPFFFLNLVLMGG